MHTTLNAIRDHRPCYAGWTRLLKALNKTQADAEPLAISKILETNGRNDAIWCLRAVEGRDKEIRLFAVWCVRQVQHKLLDERSLKALDVAEAYAWGKATHKELDAAYDAAYAVSAYTASAPVFAAAASAAASAAYAAHACAAHAAYATYAQSEELLRVCRAIEQGKEAY
jgi:hypothetical protein